jgi:DNA-binding NarL/FixJ family response regulator
VNALQIIWRDLKSWLRRKRIFSMDIETFNTLRLIAQRQNRTPQETASRLFDQAFQEQDTQSWALHRWDQLSPRQKQIAAHIWRGDTTPQIAAQLTIAQTTVKSHVEIVLRKFDVNSRIELRRLLAPWDLSGFL